MYKVIPRRTPHPVIVTRFHDRDYLSSSYILIIPLLKGGAVLLADASTPLLRNSRDDDGIIQGYPGILQGYGGL